MAPLRSRARQRGLVLLALLIMLVLVGIGALGAAEVWATSLQRDREAELLFIGEQYRRAIASYMKSSPGRRAYPPSVDVLLTDDRFPNPVHHLRKRYVDPMTPEGEFELIKVASGIVGIHTVSQDVPIKHAGFPKVYAAFEQAEHYSDWKFIYSLTGVVNLPAAGQTGGLQPPSPDASLGPAPGVSLPGHDQR